MLHFKRVQREDKEIVQITCNKCGKVYSKDVSYPGPDFTTIKNTYGYGSQKDGDKYVSHVCEPCMAAFYATFVLPPQVVGMIEWGMEPPDPVRYLGEPDPPIFDPDTSARDQSAVFDPDAWAQGRFAVFDPEADTTTTPVAPVVVEEHAPQEEEA
jgi:hypothetical protein